ncbi:MAG TPA: DUF3127 domain-containing protein [Draconibacterium sp.]|nr:DUF3127 domain-containing protein [Draconibacterium sp.]
MALSVKGRIYQILKPETGVSKAGKEWSKQEFVIETEEQFPRKVCFTLFGDKTSLISGLSAGEEVDVAFNIESRDYNGKWFHNINAWKIDKVSANQRNDGPPEYSMNDIPPEMDEDAGDLPF